MITKTLRSLGIATLLAWGCADGNRNETDGSATGSSGLTGSPGATDSDTTATATATATASDDDGVIFDFGDPGTGMSTAGDNMEGCKKVDLLFVIDNSGSMADEQQNLVASFPGFINSIQTELASTSGYHIGVVTTDPYVYNSGGCNQIGGLVTRTGGVDSSNTMCTPYASGFNWMNETDDLTAKFSCAAQVGTGGSGNEQPMEAVGHALSGPLGAAGACNEGFLRNDALLVIVIITDEEDDHETDGCLQAAQSGSSGDPPIWFDAIVQAKGSVESNIVVLALVGPDGADACPLLDKCVGGIVGAEVATRILEFTNMFTHAFVGQVCAPTYEPFFQEAVEVIKSACDDFTPPG